MTTDFSAAVETLRLTAVFRHASAAVIHRLADLALPRAVEEGGYFFLQGDRADFLYVLTSGRAKLCQLSEDGQQVNLRTLFPNQVFGAVGAVDPSRTYPACAQALENSAALALPSEPFHQVLADNPGISFGLMELMTGYIMEMQERYRELATEATEQRVARTVLRLASQFGRRTEEGLLVELAFSRQDLAEMTGTTLYTVSRILSGWEKQKIIATGREKVTLIDPHAIVRLAEGIQP